MGPQGTMGRTYDRRGGRGTRGVEGGEIMTVVGSKYTSSYILIITNNVKCYTVYSMKNKIYCGSGYIGF